MVRDQVGGELVHGWRRLRATPVFTLFAIATLAIGIGATTAVYSVVRAALGPPSGVSQPESLAYLFHYPAGSVPMHAFAWPDLRDYRERQTSFEDVAAFGVTRQTVLGPEGAETAFLEVVSGDYFDVLGVDAASGRSLQPRDDVPGAPYAIVLAHATWQRIFGGQPDVIGQPVRLAGHVFEVVGVAPPEFKGLFNGGLLASLAWVPLQTASLFESTGMTDSSDDRTRRWLRAVGRLAEGRTMEEAQVELTAIAGQLDAAVPLGTDITDARFRAPYSISRPWALVPMLDVPVNIGAASTAKWFAVVVMVVVGLVLMVACSNLANLMLARGAERRQEMAVRLALGATRWRLVRASLVESVLLAAAGGVAGVLVGRVLIVFLQQQIPIGNGDALSVSPRLDAVVLLASMGATLLALFVAGIGPALQSRRTDVRPALVADSAHGSVPRWRGRRLLIAGQVAVSVALLAVASLFLGQLREEGRRDIGIDVDHIAVADVDFGDQGIDDVRARQVIADVLGQLSGHPDVAAASVSSGLPVGISTPGSSLRAADDTTASAEFVAATDGIFDALGVPVLAGRSFDVTDNAGGDPVIVLNETAAMQLFGRLDVVGQSVEVQRRRWVGETEQQPAHTRTVVGIAGDSDAGAAGRRVSGVAYLPLAQQFENHLAFTVRTNAADPSVLVGVLGATIRAVAPDVGAAQIGTGREILAPPSVFAQISSGLTGVLGIFALGLALAGLYGVLTHLVARRTREIGVRVALGASQRQVLWLVVRQGLSPVLLGLVGGSALAWWARGVVQPGVSRFVPGLDLATLVALPALLLAVGVLACYLPARRAARVDPNEALRSL